MKRLLTFIGGLALVLTCGARPASAASVLYFVDQSLAIDRMAPALAASGHTVTTASSVANFTTLLTGGSYDLAIFFEQNQSGSDYDAAFAALTTYIAGGGRAIADDWTRNNGHTTGFQTTFTGGTNQTSMTVSNPGLQTGLVNPVLFFNPGWGVFTTGLTAGAGALCAATFANGDCGITIGNGGRTIFNGFLGDTFFTSAQGQQLYLNEINTVLGASSVPEPASMVLFGSGLALAARRLRRRKV